MKQDNSHTAKGGAAPPAGTGDKGSAQQRKPNGTGGGGTSNSTTDGGATDGGATDGASTNGVRPPSEPAWTRVVGKLRHGGERLRSLRDKGFSKVQRALGSASTRLPPTPLGALCGIADSFELTAENVLLGYAQGLFPMDYHGKLRWHCPPDRFVVYLSELRISSNMRRELKRASYTTSFDRAPREVLDACADERGEGEGTWLSERLKHIYMELFEMGAMHTFEAWQGDKLVGGSFGVSIGRVWTSESMFHRAPHAGKVQFAAAAAHLIERGFECVDGQWYSEHFARFGAREVPVAEYRACLARGMANPARLNPERPSPTVVVAPSGTAAKTEKGGQKRKGTGSGNNAPAI